MNIHHTLTVAAIAFIASAAVAADVHAQTGLSATGGARIDAEINLDTKTKLDRDTGASTSASASIETRTQSATTVRNSDRDGNELEATEVSRDERTTTTEKKHSMSISEEHRSVAATFVKSLLSIADREGGIGGDVRTVAQSQNDAASTTAAAMVKVEERGSIRTLLFGSDYRNLGIIRSALATTSTNISHLKALLGRAGNATDSAELTLQIKTLESEHAKVSAYVTAHEDTFSLFGWAAKFFAK